MSHITERLERVNDALVELALEVKPELGEGGSYELSDRLWEIAHDVAYARGGVEHMEDLEPYEPRIFTDDEVPF